MSSWWASPGVVRLLRLTTHTPFDHNTGAGYVAPHDGQYKDALSHKREVWVLVAEVTSALDETTAALLRRLATKAEIKGHADRTSYGSARAAPRDFITHHTRALSLAIATAVGDAVTMHGFCTSPLTPLPYAQAKR